MAGDSDGDDFRDDPFDDDDGEGEEFYDDDDDDSEGEELCGERPRRYAESPATMEMKTTARARSPATRTRTRSSATVSTTARARSRATMKKTARGRSRICATTPPTMTTRARGMSSAAALAMMVGCREGFFVSGFSIPDDSGLSDSLEDRSAFEAEEEEGPGLDGGCEGLMPPPAAAAFRMLVGADDTDIDYDSYSNDTDSAYSDVEVESRTLPAARAAVDGLPEALPSEKEALCGCAICKDVFASGQRVVWLPCKHYFHGDCIRPWLAIRSTCPVCRYQLPTDDAESGQRRALQLMVLVPGANQGAPPHV